MKETVRNSLPFRKISLYNIDVNINYDIQRNILTSEVLPNSPLPSTNTSESLPSQTIPQKTHFQKKYPSLLNTADALQNNASQLLRRTTITALILVTDNAITSPDSPQNPG